VPATTTTLPFTGNQSGIAGQGDDGTVAVSWSTSDGRAWTAGTVSPLTGVGADVTMLGCAATATGFVAYGEMPGPDGQQVPAVWSSPDGSTWTSLPAPTLASAESAPFTDVDVQGSTWIAVSGGATPASATAGPAGGAGDRLVPAADAVAATGPDGDAGVWLSADAGVSWSQVDTTSAAWAAGESLSTDEVASTGSNLIVVGQVDGRLAVWSGTRG
jgi:hypothetical protein